MPQLDDIKPYGNDGSKRAQVEKMFDEIAPSYDSLNHILSLGVDRIWRKEAIQYLKENATIPTTEILDVATGTGDFALLAMEQLKPQHIIGIDISEEMMKAGRKKIAERNYTEQITLKNEDCSSMSFNDNHFDAIISSFGLRNFQNLETCIGEMYRVLKKDGMLVVIDLCSPTTFPMKQLFWCYKKGIMPIIGRGISHNQHAYTYLPETMEAIPQGDIMAEKFRLAGFKNIRFHRQIFGMSMLYAANK